MGRLGTFIFGMAVGAGLLYGAMSYHVVHADDGLHLVPKLNAELQSTYVDIREFTPADWSQHPQLASALLQSDQRDLVDGAVDDALRNGIDRFLGNDR